MIYEERPYCSRLRRNGRPCRKRQIGWAWESFTNTPSPPSCGHHLTSEERAFRDQRAEAQEQWRWQWFQRIPACHEWDAPEPGQRLEQWQAKRCAMCGESNVVLVTDHCHRTLLIRGLLCWTCNIQEGIHHLSEAPLLRLYRQRPPSVIVGWAEQYWEPYSDGVVDRRIVDQLGHVPTDPAAASNYLMQAAALPRMKSTFEDNALHGVL